MTVLSLKLFRKCTVFIDNENVLKGIGSDYWLEVLEPALVQLEIVGLMLFSVETAME